MNLRCAALPIAANGVSVLGHSSPHAGHSTLKSFGRGVLVSLAQTGHHTQR